jgi:hypothetical protein
VSGESLHCVECGATWESRAAAIEIWRRGTCLVCGAQMESASTNGDSEQSGEPTQSAD